MGVTPSGSLSRLWPSQRLCKHGPWNHDGGDRSQITKPLQDVVGCVATGPVTRGMGSVTIPGSLGRQDRLQTMT